MIWKNKHVLFVLTLFVFIEVFSAIAAAGTPHIIYGSLKNSDDSIPAAGTIKFEAYIEGRPDEILTESDTGCGYQNGLWWVEPGNFQTPWSVGEDLHVSFTNTSTNGKDSENIALNEGGNQQLSLSISKSESDGGGDNCYITTAAYRLHIRKHSAAGLAWFLLMILLSGSGALIVVNGVIHKKKGIIRHKSFGYFTKLILGIIFFQLFFYNGTTAMIQSVSFDLKAGLNGISVPFGNTGITTAEKLADAVSGCDMVKYWDASQQKYVEHNKGSGENNFAVTPGKTYFVRVSEDTTWSVTGDILDYINFNLVTTDGTDINTVSLPFGVTGITNAEELGSNIPYCDTIWYWDAETQGYVGHPIGTEINNFPVTSGHSYFVNVTGNGNWQYGDVSFDATLTASPVSGLAPLTVNFYATAKDTSETVIEDYSLAFGDGSEVPPQSGTGCNWRCFGGSYSYTYETSGTYEAVLTVTNADGEIATDRITIHVSSNPPVASAELSPSNGAVPLTVYFTGTGEDSDGSISLYEWDFDGDGTFEYSSSDTGNTSHEYTQQGVFNAVFRVTDNDGLTDTADFTLTAVRTGQPGSPTATASGYPVSGDTPLDVSFYGTGIDPNGTVAKYEWDFDGDGTYDWSSSESGSTTHTYTMPGEYIVAFRVTDNSGLQSVDYIMITVGMKVSLSISEDDRTFNPTAGESIEIAPVLNAPVPAVVKLKTQDGAVIRTIPVPLGDVSSVAWDGKDNDGFIIPDGLYYAVLEYTVGNETKVFDYTISTGSEHIYKKHICLF
ncbi:MAG: PKD domain-containing protein [Desulfobacteraceae bacterium]|nr:PKD domain-containing protein [Desulfobacteraceae bacterium]